MQITCSKCKKVYNVNSSKIPMNVTTTRCKACGNSIPLSPAAQSMVPQKTPSAPPAAHSDVMRIKCPYCSKKLKIKTRAIPEGATRIRCKSCGHKIALKPNAAQAAPMSKPAQINKTVSGALNIICLYCGKKYNIKADKIPPGVTSTKCKVCGRPMSLKAPQTGAPESKTSGDSPVTQMPPPEITAPSLEDADAMVIADAGKPVNPLWKNRRMLAAAAGIILVVLAGFFTVHYWFKTSDSRIRPDKTIAKKAPAQKEKSINKTRATDAPFLAVRLNVPLLLAAVDQNMAEDKKDLRYKMTATIIKSFGLKDVELYLFPDVEHTFLPVIFATGEKGNSLESMLKAQANFVQVLEPLPDGSYRFKKEAIPADKQNSFPIDQYRVQFVDDMAIMAPENLSLFLQQGPASLIRTRVAQMIAAVAQPGDLATLSVRIPENLDAEWQKKIQSNPAVQQNPQANMMIAIGGGVLTQLAEPLKDVDSLAISFRLDDAKNRMLSYAQ